MIALERFHHVGCIVEAIAPACELWRGQGYVASAVFSDPNQKAEIVLLTRSDGPMIELVAPFGPESPAHTWLKRIKAGAYHTCYEVESLTAARDQLVACGFAIVMEPVPAIAFGMRRVCFTWSKHTGLVELLERNVNT